MGKNTGKEFAAFTGLANTIDPSLIPETLLQEAWNSAVNRIPGDVTTRLGINSTNSTNWGTDVDLFWQNVCATASMLMRSSDILYDNYRPIKWNLDVSPMEFCEYNAWVVAVNGYENLKYKNSGTVLSWNTSYSSPVDEGHLLSTMYACLLVFNWAVGEYFTTSLWEVDQIEVAATLRNTDGFYTSTCYKNLTTSYNQFKALLHFDGSHGSTTITNEGTFGSTFTCYGHAQLSVASPKFGTAAAIFDGAGDDYISGAMGSSAFDWGIDFWFNLDSVATAGTYGLWQWIYMTKLLKVDAVVDAGGVLTLLVTFDGAGAFYDFTITTGAISKLGWHHLAMQFTWCDLVTGHNKFDCYIDGLLQGSANAGYAGVFGFQFDTMTFGRALTTVILGTYTYFYGAIDEFAYRLGQIFTAEFSMPTSAYVFTAWIQNAYEVNAPCKLGITPPISALTGADSGGGSGPNGAYYYKVTYLNVDGYESNPGPASLVVNTVNHAITLTNIPISPDPQVVERRIYRTKAGFTTYYYVKSILNNICKNVDDFTAVTTTPYLDSAADTALILEVATNHDEPVPFSEVSSHYSLLYGVEAAERNKVWECTEVDEWEYFAPGNYYTFGSQNDITYVLTSLGEYLCGIQQDKIWTLNTSVTPLEKQKSLSEYGVNSSGAVANKGDAILLGNIAGVWYFAKQNFFEAAKTVSASTSVRTLFENFSTNPDRVDPDEGDMIAVGYAEGQVFISYPTVGSSFNNRTVHINLDQKTVEAVWGIGFAAFTLDQATKKLYGLETVSGKVCQLRTTDQDDGSDIAWFMKTKDFGKEFGGLTLKKRGNIVKIDCNPNNKLLTVMVFVDGVQVDTKDITGTSRKTERWRLPIDYDWYRIAFKVVGTGYQIVYGFGVEAEVLDF